MQRSTSWSRMASARRRASPAGRPGDTIPVLTGTEGSSDMVIVNKKISDDIYFVVALISMYILLCMDTTNDVRVRDQGSQCTPGGRMSGEKTGSHAGNYFHSIPSPFKRPHIRYRIRRS